MLQSLGPTDFPASGSIFQHFANAGSVGTGETDLYSDTLAANTFSTNGDTVSATYGGTTTNTVTVSKTFRVYLGGTKVFDSGALTPTAAGVWILYVTAIRVSSSVVRVVTEFASKSLGLAASADYLEVTGLTLTNTQVLKISGQCGVGGANNDIVASLASVILQPAT